MTAEPDALRLVPVNARDLDALRYVLNRADEASRIRTVMSTFTLPERETTAERLERLYATLKDATPAVQAAGREEIAQAIDPDAWDDGQFAEPGGTAQRWSQDAARQAAERVLALAHPPAQDSESGGEVERVIALMREKGVEFRDGELCWPFDGVRDGFPLNAQERADLQAALSQPGPAAEGGPAHD